MEFAGRLASIKAYPLRADRISVLQANLGYRCNLSCRHCHVEAGPDRQEVMGRDTIDAIIAVLERTAIPTLDITGGAPELNPHFRFLVEAAGSLGCHVIVRSNLTVFAGDGMDDLPRFYRDHGVEVVASLPYYLGGQVDRVRGDRTFELSVKALRELNSLGYGGDGLLLSLVYNPQGMFLPPPQARLEEEYRKELDTRHGIRFSRLFALANMPIGRFRQFLITRGQFERYMEALRCAFNPAAVSGLMCRHLVSVGWDGTLCDCDFNQVAGIPVIPAASRTLHDFDMEALSGREIAVAEHCYGCTAGQGST